MFRRKLTMAELLTDICDETNGEDHNDSRRVI